MMLRSIPRVLGILLALACSSAARRADDPDPTGMWYDPGQPGWGVSVTQQGETIFVVLFVYDANHNPQWFVASNVVDTGQFVNTLVGEAYAGPLYRTNGASFSATRRHDAAFGYARGHDPDRLRATRSTTCPSPTR